MLSRDGFKSEAGKRLWDEIFGMRDIAPRRKAIGSGGIAGHKPSPETLPTASSPAPRPLPRAVSPAPAPKSLHRPSPSAGGRQPSLHELVNVFHHKGLVGAEKEVLCVSLCGLSRIPFVVLGPSRGGKTYVTDLALSMLEDEVYRLEFATGSSLFNACGRISSSGIVYFPELQKSWRDADVRDVFKGLLEGRDMTRTLTKGGKVETQTIKAGASLAATLAYENKKIDDILMESPEMLARVAIVTVSPSPEHIREVNDVEAYRRASILDEEFFESEERNAKLHLRNASSSGVRVVNPFADYLKDLLPSTQKSMGYNKHFFDFVEALTRFHQFDRSRATLGGKEYVLCDLADCHYAHELFYSDFIRISRVLATEEERPLFDALPPLDLHACLSSGYAQLDQGEGLKKLRLVQPCIAKRWYERQVVNGAVMAPNYATGLPEPILEGV